MNHYLLDTHTAIWFFNGDNALSETAKQIILDPSNIKSLSIVCAWELSIKISLGRLDFAGKAAGFLQLAGDNGFNIIPVKPAHLTVLEKLPFIHRAPFDRLLTATAIAEQMTLITADDNIARYDVFYTW